MRRGPGTLYRRWKSLQFLATRDRGDVAAFLAADLPMSRAGRVALLYRYTRITNAVRGYHTLGEMLAVTREVLTRPRPTVVEVGCAHGSSTAKLSLAVRAAGGSLHVFDTFRGIPTNDERHTHVDGRPVVFRAGAFRATRRAVERTLRRHGAPEVCTLYKGRAEETLAALAGPVDVALIDVDLLATTRACLVDLVPRLRPGGVVISLDGQLQATHALLADADFWRRDVGMAPPPIDGLGRGKLLAIRP